MESSLIPDSYKKLSGSASKVIAVITMFIDHIGAYFPRQMSRILFPVGGGSLRLYTVLRFIGRLSFPLFCFLLVEGFLHTHDRQKYGIRLLLFALVTEPFWNLVHSGTWRYESQNALFTLLFGFLALCLAERLEQGRGNRLQNAVLLISLLILAVVFKADYGCAGFGFVLMLYLLRKQPLFRAVTGSCILSSRWQAGLAFIPIAFYNGKRGFLHGRAASLCFYAIYPIQMILFYIIKKNTIGF